MIGNDARAENFVDNEDTKTDLIGDQNHNSFSKVELIEDSTSIHADDHSNLSPQSDEELRQQLIEELDELVIRLQVLTPEYTPPPFSLQRLMELMIESLGKVSPKAILVVLERLRSSIKDDLLDIDTWKGIWYVLNYSIEYQRDKLKRRFSGDYETDEWGFDPEVLDAVKPFFDFLYEKYWRVETTGIENIPNVGRALLVCNHSGQLPWDGAMLGTAIYNEHPSQRIVRNLYASWFPRLPFISVLLVKLGQVLSNDENGIRLLEQDQLVVVFPEGVKGLGKLYRDRYQLARFGRGGFVRMAIQTGAPIIPVSIVGAEETYVSLKKFPLVPDLTGFPIPPISPTWPWFGLLGLVPLPTKWFIDIGEPILTDDYGSEVSTNLVIVSQLSDLVRNKIQEMILLRLSLRQSVFTG